ncbi:MAG: ribosome maturation factor RimM [Streptosporangiales bacterium]|nr:ribosome maturation factor RimM [Streptosporangiales bacterium]
MELVVGRVGRPHGIRGELLVEVLTDDPAARFAPGSVLATSRPGVGPLTVERTRWHSGRLLVTFAGVTDRSAAEAMGGTQLLVDSADLPAIEDPDEFYDHELVELTVETTDGVPVGVVVDVLHHGQDILVVRSADVETLVPFVAAIVPKVDLAAGRLVIDPPPGLLDQ